MRPLAAVFLPRSGLHRAAVTNFKLLEFVPFFCNGISCYLSGNLWHTLSLMNRRQIARSGGAAGGECDVVGAGGGGQKDTEGKITKQEMTDIKTVGGCST
jgi:hypothetical protein